MPVAMKGAVGTAEDSPIEGDSAADPDIGKALGFVERMGAGIVAPHPGIELGQKPDRAALGIGIVVAGHDRQPVRSADLLEKGARGRIFPGQARG